MGVKKATSAVSPRSAAAITRLNSLFACSLGDIVVRSVVAAPPPVAPTGTCCGCGPDVARETATTTSITTAAPATIHGVLEPAGLPPGAAPAGAPQLAQNFAPAFIDDPQLLQVGFPSGVPHSVQNLPVDSAPHLGHFELFIRPAIYTEWDRG